MVSLSAAVATMALCAPGQTMLLDFYADWCGPCRQMAPVVEQLAQQGYPVQKVNVDQHPELAARFRITSIPCFVMVVDGREAGRIVGWTTPAELAQMFRSGVGATKSAAPAPEARAPLVAHTTPQTGPDVSTTAQAIRPPAAWPDGSGSARRENLDQHLIAATVRLRVEDPSGRSCGTGTIIDARQGEALILTCGHLFRDSQGQGDIEVDLFGPRPVRGVPGRLIAYNLDRDVALLSIRTPGPVAVARVAPPDYRLAPGQAAVSVGCNHGQDPTVLHSRITSIDRYLGPPNLQVAGQSVEGRSGGGIFSAEGLVVGVCNAAEPKDNESFCAALAAVHQQLDEAGLAFVYDKSHAEDDSLLAVVSGPSAGPDTKATPMVDGISAGANSSGPVVPGVALATGPAAVEGLTAPGAEGASMASAEPAAGSSAIAPPATGPALAREQIVPVGPVGFALPTSPALAGHGVSEAGGWASVTPGSGAGDRPASPSTTPEDSSVAQGGSHGPADWVAVVEAPGCLSTPTSGAAAEQQALVELIRRRLAEGADVVCLIRTPGDPSGLPQVIALDDASPALVEQLAAAVRQRRQLTSLEVPDRSQSARSAQGAAEGLARVQPARRRPVRPVWLPSGPAGGQQGGARLPQFSDAPRP